MALILRTGNTVSIAIAGVAVQLNSSTPNARTAASVLVQSDLDNANRIYIGDSSVAISNGFILTPGDSIEITGDQRKNGQDEVIINDIYIVGTGVGDKVRVGYFIKRSGPNWS